MDLLSGYGRPTKRTKALVGQYYKDLDTGDIYRCVSANENSRVNLSLVGGYIWERAADSEHLEVCETFCGGGGEDLHNELDKLTEEIEALKNSDLKTIEYEITIGRSWMNDGTYYVDKNVMGFSHKIDVIVGMKINPPTSDYKYSVLCYGESGTEVKYVPWTSGSATTITDGVTFIVKVARVDGANPTESDVTAVYDSMTITYEETGNDARNDVISSCLVDYGRTDGSNYVFVRIPKTTIGGRTVMPKVRLTSVDGSIDGAKRSALRYSRDNMCAFVIDAGLFDTTTNRPLGQTIIDGVSIVNEPHPQGANNETISDTECYPLCIDANGVLSAPYNRNANTVDMIADGIVYATTGWIKIVEDYDILEDEIATEIVHPGKYSSQIIGQYQNGDYAVLTCDVNGYANNIENTTGLTYTQLAQIMVDNGVKFAYALDGGGSAETVIGNRQLNAIYEGTTGRAIPAVIVFETK